jgi:hypothetical protein
VDLLVLQTKKNDDFATWCRLQQQQDLIRQAADSPLLETPAGPLLPRLSYRDVRVVHYQTESIFPHLALKLKIAMHRRAKIAVNW